MSGVIQLYTARLEAGVDLLELNEFAPCMDLAKRVHACCTCL